MAARNKTPRRDAVLAVLRETGPLTSQAIAERLDWDVSIVTYTIGTARRTRPNEMFRIVRYTPRVGAWGNDMAVFSAAGGPDAVRQPADIAKRRQAARKRHRDSNLAVYRAKDRARKGGSIAGTPAGNPWLQLADKSARGRMGQIAANTTMAEAA